MININSNSSIYSIISNYPDVKNIMVELGFKDIVKPGMLQSMGRIMTINKGCSMKNIDIEIVREVFLKYNYTLEEE
jgi:hypothetical protein